jgi:hypothetical protein
MKLPIPPGVLALPEGESKANLIWCASIASMIDWGNAPLDVQVLWRAVNSAVEVAIGALQQLKEYQDRGL